MTQSNNKDSINKQGQSEKPQDQQNQHTTGAPSGHGQSGKDDNTPKQQQGGRGEQAQQGQDSSHPGKPSQQGDNKSGSFGKDSTADKSKSGNK